MVYLVNISKADFIAKKNKWLGKIAAWVQSHGGGCIIPFSIAFESELKAAADSGQRSEYLESVSPAISSIPKMIRQVYFIQPFHPYIPSEAMIVSATNEVTAVLFSLFCRAIRTWS